MTFVRERSEKFDLGRVVSRTLGTIQSDFATFYAVALVCGLPTALAQMLQVGTVAPGVFRSPWAAFSPWVLLGVLIYIFARAFCDCLLIGNALAAFNGRKQPFDVQLRNGLAVILPVIGIYLLSLLAIAAASTLLLVPGLIVMCMLCVAIPAGVAERTGVIGALSRSVALTRGWRWPIFGTLVLYIVAVWIVSGIVALIAGLLFFGGVGKSYLTVQGSPLAYVGIVVSTLITAVVTMISAVGLAALYAELRLVKEGPQTNALAEVFA
jgi:hypothetical protein